MSTDKIVFALLASLITISGAFALVPEMSPSGRFTWPADAPPDLTPARLQLQKMLEAFNSGHREVLEKYRAENLSPFWRHPPDNDAALWWQKSTGGWVLVALEDKSPTSVVALLRNVDSDDLFSPETGQVIVVLANFDEPTARNVSRFIAARLPGPEFDIPHVQLSKTR